MTFTICTKCLYTQAHTISLVTHFALDYGYYYCKCCVAFFVSLMPRVPPRSHSANGKKITPNTHERAYGRNDCRQQQKSEKTTKNDTIENCPRAIYLYYSSSTYFPQQFTAAVSVCVSSFSFLSPFFIWPHEIYSMLDTNEIRVLLYYAVFSLLLRAHVIAVHYIVVLRACTHHAVDATAEHWLTKCKCNEQHKNRQQGHNLCRTDHCKLIRFAHSKCLDHLNRPNRLSGKQTTNNNPSSQQQHASMEAPHSSNLFVQIFDKGRASTGHNEMRFGNLLSLRLLLLS